MVRQHRPPSQGWAPSCVITRRTPRPRPIYGADHRIRPAVCLIIVRLDRRDLIWINVTAHPTAEWIARRITQAFPWDETPRYLIRDRDGIYGDCKWRLRAMGIRDKPTSAGSPWQNCFAERLIGSIRRECVDTSSSWANRTCVGSCNLMRAIIMTSERIGL